MGRMKLEGICFTPEDARSASSSLAVGAMTRWSECKWFSISCQAYGNGGVYGHIYRTTHEVTSTFQLTWIMTCEHK
jgi:hypothetical protein